MLAEFLVVLEGFKSSSERGDLLSRARLRLADPSRLDKDIAQAGCAAPDQGHCCRYSDRDHFRAVSASPLGARGGLSGRHCRYSILGETLF